jgi:hypothetical protein
MNIRTEQENMKIYKQSNEYTGGAASLMMVLNNLDCSYPLTKEKEFDIWQRSALLPVRATCIYGLAKVAQDKNLSIKVIVGKKDYSYPDYRFKSYTLREIEDASFSSSKQYKEAKDQGIQIEERDITIKDIKSSMKKDMQVIVRLNAQIFRGGKPSSHFFPVFSYENSKFLIVDPKKGELQSLSENDMKEALNSVNTKCKRDKRMLIINRIPP